YAYARAAAARRSVGDFARDTGWSGGLVESLEGVRLRPPVEAAAFRILQEALANARRHAGTTRIEVVLAREADRFHLDVRDHGVGLAESAGARGLGLASMRERARLLGGSCVVEPAQGGGTRVHAQLPLSHGLAATPGAGVRARPDRRRPSHGPRGAPKHARARGRPGRGRGRDG